MASSVLLVTLLAVVTSSYLIAPRLVLLVGKVIGSRVKSNCRQRRELILARVQQERRNSEEKTVPSTLDDEWEKVSRHRDDAEPSGKDWDGIVGFFHPFCNAGGGGERVLWAAIRATQQKWPNAVCVIYTGDHEVTKEQILKRVEDRFAIRLRASNVVLLYLSTRHLVLASNWPNFTLLGQSLGSIVVAWDAFNLLVPDMFVDTVGYAFTLALSKFLFPRIPTGAYVHYPTISTDMLGSLNASPTEGRGLNAGAGKGLRGQLKRKYWQLFARLYSWSGGNIDIVMANGTWTAGHIRQLWGSARAKRNAKFPIDVVFPSCAVEDMEQKIKVDVENENRREPKLIYIAQFRPEKNHQLILRAFAELLKNDKYSDIRKDKEPQLMLLGSVRDTADETYIYSLRLLVNELHITKSVSFVLNAPWSRMLQELQTSSVGVNGMWNEHFGMGVVEYQAAGLISVVHDSGGPKWDIVTDQGDGPTGYHASSEKDFADGFAKALSLSGSEALKMRLRVRQSAKRFSEAAFDEQWTQKMERLILITRQA